MTIEIWGLPIYNKIIKNRTTPRRPTGPEGHSPGKDHKMDYSKMSMDKLRELIAWADDRAAYRRACGTISGTAYAEDEAAVRAALAEINRRARATA